TRDVLLLILLRPAAHDAVGGGEHEVAEDLRARSLLRQGLRREPDPGTQLEDVDAAHLLVQQPHGAGGRMHARAGQLQERRLARAVGTQHRPVLAVADGEAQIVEEVRLSSADTDGIEFHHCTHGAHSILPAMLTTTPLLPVLFATAATARLTDRAAPDTVSHAFDTAGLPVPLIVDDAVFAPPA